MVMITCNVEDFERFKLGHSTEVCQSLDLGEGVACDQVENGLNANSSANTTKPENAVKKSHKTMKKKRKVAKSRKVHVNSCGTSWSPEEDKLLLDLVTEHGNQWKMINPHFPNRSGSSIRSRYHSYLKKRKATSTDAHSQETNFSSKRIKTVDEPGSRYVTENLKIKRLDTKYLGEAVPDVRKGKRKKMKYAKLLLLKSKYDPLSPNPGKPRTPLDFNEKRDQLIHKKKDTFQKNINATETLKNQITGTSSSSENEITTTNALGEKVQLSQTIKEEISDTNKENNTTYIGIVLSKNVPASTHKIGKDNHESAASSFDLHVHVDHENGSNDCSRESCDREEKKEMTSSPLKLSLCSPQQEPEKKNPALNNVICENLKPGLDLDLKKSIYNAQVLNAVRCSF